MPPGFKNDWRNRASTRHDHTYRLRGSWDLRALARDTGSNDLAALSETLEVKDEAVSSSSDKRRVGASSETLRRPMKAWWRAEGANALGIALVRYLDGSLAAILRMLKCCWTRRFIQTGPSRPKIVCPSGRSRAARGDTWQIRRWERRKLPRAKWSTEQLPLDVIRSFCRKIFGHFTCSQIWHLLTGFLPLISPPCPCQK